MKRPLLFKAKSGVVTVEVRGPLASPQIDYFRLVRTNSAPGGRLGRESTLWKDEHAPFLRTAAIVANAFVRERAMEPECDESVSFDRSPVATPYQGKFMRELLGPETKAELLVQATSGPISAELWGPREGWLWRRLYFIRAGPTGGREIARGFTALENLHLELAATAMTYAVTGKKPRKRAHEQLFPELSKQVFTLAR